MDLTAIEGLIRDAAITLSHCTTHPGPRTSTRVAWPEMSADWMAYADDEVMLRPYAALDIDTMDRVLLVVSECRIQSSDKKVIWLHCVGLSWRRVGHQLGRSHEWARQRYLRGMPALLVDFKQKFFN